ncbi:hypothetical protein K437DRAFT_225693 [Tilletiaria anomala UBC 951]|uniref:DNA polymerase epsilon subunit B n=1 Tax=Tilletiaria anomala (strain ATCC 24038 / CBS 436.72 / UBC 951) TaxID=1037660 RepID=A0A066VNK3_TILAU|nr:uncharacterized protein K437DRAFT_225693 [Tilletiaria anomala UBC 951]KDN43322.1 hypothetical protein K437DRAFT_225693 [Tilletiaria anomala UBC 951]
MPDITAPLRKSIVRIFTRKYNLQLHASALTFIAEAFDHHGLNHKQSQWDDAIEFLAKEFINGEQYKEGSEGKSGFSLSSGWSSSLVTRAALEAVYQQMMVSEENGNATAASGGNRFEGAQNGTIEYTHDGEKLSEGAGPDPANYFKVVGAFDMPRNVFDPHRKNFDKAARGTFLPLAVARPTVLRERLSVVKNIVLRNENFLPPLALGKGREREQFMKLTSIKNLAGRQGQRFLLLGLLCTTDDGQYALEDLDGVVLLDLSEAIPGEGIFTEGCIILVEGEYTYSDRLKVFAIGHPPSEPRHEARAMYGHVDFLGTGSITLKDEEVLKSYEQMHHEVCMVVISDLHLDHPKTLANFQTMLQGYVDAKFVPFVFVLCGNFCSDVNGTGDVVKRYTDAFGRLADIIEAFPDVLRTSHFVFVPGPNDPFPSKLLPKRPLPASMTQKLRDMAPNNIHFTTNPCRIRYFSQEVVIFREDLMARMLRNVVQIKDEQQEEEGVDLRKYLVSTILDQAHLCPLPQQVRPIAWDFDHTLRLYPMPTALILADKYDRFDLTYETCKVFSPGSFRGTEYGWSTFYFSSNSVERRCVCGLPPAIGPVKLSS